MPQYQGIWSLQQQAQAQTNQQWVTDPYFKNTTLLVQADNALNSGQNNVFYDSSNVSATVTRTGNVAQGSFTPFSPGWSNYFPSGSYLSMPSATTALALGSGDWTVECFAYVTDTSDNRTLLDIYDGNSSVRFIWRIKTTGLLAFQGSNGTDRSVTTTTVPTNAWVHLAICKASGTTRMFINGIQANSNYTDTNTYTNSGASAIGIIASDFTSSPYLGYISNFRIVKGTALYTSAFTPSTSPLTSVTNTQLLLCQSNRFLDNSPNAFAVTASGSPSVQAFSPFNTSYAVTPSTYSVLFDGANAYANVISTATSANLILANSDFTIESWIFPRTLGTEKAIISKWSNTTGGRSWVFELNSNNQPTFLYSTDGAGTLTLTSTANVVGNAWTHLAITRSGNTANIWVNGVPSGSNASFTSNIFAANVANVNIGRYMSGASNVAVWNGLISSTRVVKGNAVYTANFTPPTGPLTTIANTSLLVGQSSTLINSSNSRITLTTQGNVVITSSVIPFADSFQDNTPYLTTAVNTNPYPTVSLSLDAVSSYYTPASSITNIIGTSGLTTSSTFTIEASIYLNAYSANQSTIIGDIDPAGGTTYFSLYVNPTGKLVFGWYRSPTTYTATGNATIPLNEWTSVAVTISGTSIYLFVNGILQTLTGTTTNNGANSTLGYISLGAYNASASYGLNGYIYSARITKSALYTASYTSSTGRSIPLSNTGFFLTNNAFGQIIDGSSNNYSLITYGSPSTSSSVVPTGTLLPLPATGGSAYFNGTSYLTWPGTIIGSGAFTIEFWFYNNTDFSVNRQPIGVINTSGYDSALDVRIANSTTINVSQYNVANNNFTVPTMASNTWYHVAITRNASNATTVFLNGIRSSTGAVSIGTNFSGSTSSIGRIDQTNVGAWNGYLSDVRIVTASNIYDPNHSSIAVPTAPLTPVANTKFLLNYTNASIFDATMKNNLETVGNAQISTDIKKFGSGIMYFDGSSGVVGSSRLQTNFGTGDFTIESWIYPTNLTNTFQTIFSCCNDTASATGFYAGISNNPAGPFVVSNGSALITATASKAINISQWTHWVLVRQNTKLSFYINGILQPTQYTSTESFTDGFLLIGQPPASGANAKNYFNGYMDDVRITKGIARYTSNFIPPKQALPRQ
jgi:Concanavalin A-like lectin/glucanases superfamily